MLLASDGQEAIETAAHWGGPVHILLTDVVLPKPSGAMAAVRICAVHPAAKVIYMSRYNDGAWGRCWTNGEGDTRGA